MSNIKLSTILPMLAVIAIMASGFMLAVGDLQSKYSFNTSVEFSDFYEDVNTTYSRVSRVQGNVENKTGFLSGVGGVVLDGSIGVIRMVIDSFALPLKLLDSSLQSLGIPTDGIIKKALIIMIVSSLLFAVAAVVWIRRDV